jgi:hypothetical protein
MLASKKDLEFHIFTQVVVRSSTAQFFPPQPFMGMGRPPGMGGMGQPQPGMGMGGMGRPFGFNGYNEYNRPNLAAAVAPGHYAL